MQIVSLEEKENCHLMECYTLMLFWENKKHINLTSVELSKRVLKDKEHYRGIVKNEYLLFENSRIGFSTCP